MRYIILTLFVFLSTICNGQKRELEFKMENDSTIIQFLDSKNIEYSKRQVATLKGIGTFGEFGRAKKLTIPDAYFFTSQGQMIENSGKGENCAAALSKLEKLAKMKFDPAITLQNFLKDVTILEHSDFVQENIDLYVIITWGKFASSESETSFKWLSSLQNQEKLKIKVLLLNLDVHEKWNLNEDQKKYLGII